MIVHVDMDAFFASVEQMDDPTLRGVPLVVGGGTRGVVSTASYEARKYGIHSAMPAVTARRLCPRAVFVRPRFRRYAEISGRVMRALGDFGGVVEEASIDEAYLDVDGMGRIWGDLPNLVARLRERVREVTGGLTCSVGAAPVKFLAKICSDINKPDGVFLLEEKDMDAFLLALDVRRIPGVGRSTWHRLESFGIRTCADVRRFSRDFWKANFGSWGLVLCDRAHGIDPRRVSTGREPRSESAETTFLEDVTDRAVLARRLLALSERVGTRLRAGGHRGRTVTLKIKYADFSQTTRSITLDHPVASTRGIHEAGLRLLDKEPLAGPVRLVGIGVSRFGAAERLTLPGMPATPGSAAGELRDRRLDEAVDALRGRFGRAIVVRGSLLEEEQARRREEEAEAALWWGERAGSAGACATGSGSGKKE